MFSGEVGFGAATLCPSKLLDKYAVLSVLSAFDAQKYAIKRYFAVRAPTHLTQKSTGPSPTARDAALRCGAAARLAKLRVPQGRPRRADEEPDPQVGASRAQGARRVGGGRRTDIGTVVERAQSSLAKSGPRAASTHGAGTLLRCNPVQHSPPGRREALGTGRAFPSRRRLSSRRNRESWRGSGAGGGPTRLDTMTPGVLMGRAASPRERGKIFDGAN